MIDQTTGIILRTYPLTETSLVVHWLTADYGRIGTAARGARRPKSPFRGKLDLFYEGRLTIQRSRRSDLHALREFELSNSHAGLRTDLDHLNQAAYCAALIQQASETDTPVPELFALLSQFLRNVPKSAARARSVLAFELKLLNFLGLTASLQPRDLSAASLDVIRVLEEADWNDIAQSNFSAGQWREIADFLHGFLTYHLGKVPASRARALSSSQARSARLLSQ